VNPEQAIETGVYNRLTDATNGITVAAGKYCHNTGGVKKFQGKPSLDEESMEEWAQPGLSQGPVVLIVVGEEMEADTDRVQLVLGTFSIDLYLAEANYRTTHEAFAGDAAGAARKPGIWQLKADILDRLLGHTIVADHDSAWLESGETVETDGGTALYRVRLRAMVAYVHTLTPWSSGTPYEGADVTLEKVPSTEGDEFETDVKVDL